MAIKSEMIPYKMFMSDWKRRMNLMLCDDVTRTIEPRREWNQIKATIKYDQQPAAVQLYVMMLV